MTAILVLGFFLGLRHALEGDHVAAMATLVARERSLHRTIAQGAVWALGHAVTLFSVGALVLVFDVMIREHVAHGLEALVGAMLMVLGIDVLYRLRRECIHFHRHQHANGQIHFHAHSHKGEAHHDPAHHHHEHHKTFPLRALGVGMMHGLAGSAALMLLTLESTGSIFTGLLYIALFGLGATAGMIVLTTIIALPLGWSARSATWLHRGLQGIVGTVTIILGSLLLIQSSLFLL